mmetsp:Transcript_158873/g.289633  ORF Transcript_158873/g.289633 Transcript_158873/m.289633 type:complete len:254 (+) Transcript_158873:62-823(+)
MPGSIRKKIAAFGLPEDAILRPHERPPGLSLDSSLDPGAPSFTPLNPEAQPHNPHGLQKLPPGKKMNNNRRKQCRRHRRRCHEMLCDAKQAVEQCMMVQDVEIAESNFSCSINMTVCREYLQHRELILTVAKTALLGSAQASRDVYVIGYRGRPFLPTHDGFYATLGVMICKEEYACWASFGYGSCSNGENCRLHHPIYQLPIYVKVRCPDEPPGLSASYEGDLSASEQSQKSAELRSESARCGSLDWIDCAV